MNKENINRIQAEIIRELPWINKITSEEDYQNALAYLKTLMEEKNAQPFFLKLITDRLSEYENERNEMLLVKSDVNKSETGLAALITLMGHHKLKNLALVDVLGSTSLVSQILNGKRALTITHIYALAEYFNVKPAVFI